MLVIEHGVCARISDTAQQLQQLLPSLAVIELTPLSRLRTRTLPQSNLGRARRSRTTTQQSSRSFQWDAPHLPP